MSNLHLRMLACALVFQLMLLGSCTKEKDIEPAPDSGISDHAVSAGELGGPNWENWGGGRFPAHAGLYAPNNFAAIQHEVLNFGLGYDIYSEPVVISTAASGWKDEIFVTDDASNLHRVNWGLSNNLFEVWSQSPPVGSLTAACTSTPAYGLDGKLHYLVSTSAGGPAVGLASLDVATSIFLPVVAFAGQTPHFASPIAAMPHSSLDHVYLPTSEGVVSYSLADNRLHDLFRASKNVAFSGCAANPLNLAMDWNIVCDRGSAAPPVPCEVDCWWPTYDGPMNAIDHRYTTRGSVSLVGLAPGIGGLSQGVACGIWDTSLTWPGHVICNTTQYVYYLRPDPQQPPGQLPRNLKVQSFARTIQTEPYCSPVAVRKIAPGALYWLAVVKDISGINGAGTTGLLEVYSITPDFDGFLDNSLLSPFYTCQFPLPTIHSPTFDVGSGHIWVSAQDRVHVFNVSVPGAPVWSSPNLGTVRSSPVLGGHFSHIGSGRNRIYVNATESGHAKLHSFYQP